jgi:hypothetical protein
MIVNGERVLQWGRRETRDAVRSFRNRMFVKQAEVPRTTKLRALLYALRVPIASKRSTIANQIDERSYWTFNRLTMVLTTTRQRSKTYRSLFVSCAYMEVRCLVGRKVIIGQHECRVGATEPIARA